MISGLQWHAFYCSFKKCLIQLTGSSIQVVGFYVSSYFDFPLVTIVQQFLLVVEHFLSCFCWKFKIRTLCSKQHSAVWKLQKPHWRNAVMWRCSAVKCKNFKTKMYLYHISKPMMSTNYNNGEMPLKFNTSLYKMRYYKTR